MSMIEEVPERYRWLMDEPAPLMIVKARKWIGLKEERGNKNNPWILKWAEFIGGWIASFYTKDSIPWCGLFIGMITISAKKPRNARMLAARSWAKWGKERIGPPMLGDILVFWRGRPDGSKGHVGLYVAEDETAYHVLGGNQGDAVSIVRISKSRLICARHFYKIGQPANVRRIHMNSEGVISTNEA